MNLRLASTCAALCVLLSGSAASAQVTEISEKEAQVKAQPKSWEAHAALGVAYLRAGRFAQADAQMARAESLAKGDPRGVLRHAEVAIAQGDYKRARARCKTLFKDREPPALAHVCMARAFLAWNRSERAFEELEAALARDPDSAEAHLALGHAHRIRSQVPEAEAAYARAKQDATLAAEAQLGLGQLYVAAGRKADAVEALRGALALEPNWPEVQYQLALLLDGSDEAKALLARALEGRPNWAEPALALAELRFAAGDLEGAEAAYRKAIAAEAQLAAAHAGLAQTLLALGRVPEAEASANKALSLVENDARAALVRAEVLVRKGQFEEALEAFRHAADLNPRDPFPLYRAVQVSLDQRRAVLAQGFLDRLLAAHPKYEPALELHRDIARVRGISAGTGALSAGSVPPAP